MVKIENVIVETDKIYYKNDEDSAYSSGTSKEVLILKIKIPGGKLDIN